MAKLKVDDMALKKKYWVCRMADVIELRASIYPLKQIRTKFTKTTLKKVRSYDYSDLNSYGEPKLKTIEQPVRLVLEQTFFEGGKVLGTYHAMNWSRVATGLGLAPLKADSCLSITREVADIIRQRKG